jgi:hypothetical protein
MTHANNSLIEGFSGKIDFGDGNSFEINDVINMNKLNLLAGMNGTGKTVFMILNWATTLIMSLYQISLKINPKQAEKSLAEIAHLVFDLSFDVEDNFYVNIKLNGHYEEQPFVFSIIMEEGELTLFDFDIPDLNKFRKGQISTPVFMSKNTRLFSDYDKYRKMVKKMKIDPSLNILDAKELKGIWPLYDIMAFAKLKNKIESISDSDFSAELHPLKLVTRFLGDTDPLFKGLEKFTSIDGDLMLNFEDGSTKKAASLSTGEQATLMMIFMVGA